ncbi:MAG: S49 family peptidase [Planctomycetota bacterium]
MSQPSSHAPIESVWAVETAFASQLFSALQRAPDSIVGESTINVVNSNGVAIMEVRGVLTKYPSVMQAVFGGAATTDLQEAFQAAIDDSGIHAICLVMDSPGGAISGIPEMADAIFAARQSGKQVVAQIDGLMASAAYYLGSQADKVYASHKANRIGSIGTMMVLQDSSKQAAMQGIDVCVATTGELKPMGVPGVALTDAMKAAMQGIVTAGQADFAAAIQRGRKLTPEQLGGMSDGRVVSATEAVTTGLIDGIQSLNVTLAALQGSNKKFTKKGNSMAEATYAELKAECVGASAEFIVQCLEKKLEPEAARSLWLSNLTASSTDLTAKLTEANATVTRLTTELAAEKAKTAGTSKGKEVPSGGANQNSGELSAVQQFKDGVNAIAAKGVTRSAAVVQFVRENPEVHQAYLAETIAMRGGK